MPLQRQPATDSFPVKLSHRYRPRLRVRVGPLFSLVFFVRFKGTEKISFWQEFYRGFRSKRIACDKTPSYCTFHKRFAKSTWRLALNVLQIYRYFVITNYLGLVIMLYKACWLSSFKKNRRKMLSVFVHLWACLLILSGSLKIFFIYIHNIYQITWLWSIKSI